MTDTEDLSRGVRLVDYAKEHLIAVPVGAIGDLIASGAVRIGDRVGRIDDAVTATPIVDPIAIASLVIAPEPLPLAIVHEDDELLVCDKPAGMHVHPLGAHRTGTLLNALLWHAGARPDQPWGRWRPRPLHRLDRAASGLMAIAKTAATEMHVIASPGSAGARSEANVERRSIDRRYRATVRGVIAGDAGTIDAPLGRDPALDYRRAVVAGGKRAVTHWRVVERLADRTVVELRLETGRTHQIRAHLASIGHPIVDDVLYASGGPAAGAIALHAFELRIGDRTWHSGPPPMYNPGS